jgi:hypothetical protein
MLSNWELFNIINEEPFDAEKTLLAIEHFLKTNPKVVHETMNYIEGLAEMYKKEYMRIRELKKKEEEKFDFIKKMILHYMKENDVKKIQTPQGVLSKRRIAPKLNITDESKIPEEYFKVERTINLLKVKSAIKENKIDPSSFELIENEALFRK